MVVNHLPTDRNHLKHRWDLDLGKSVSKPWNPSNQKFSHYMKYTDWLIRGSHVMILKEHRAVTKMPKEIIGKTWQNNNFQTFRTHIDSDILSPVLSNCITYIDDFRGSWRRPLGHPATGTNWIINVRIVIFPLPETNVFEPKNGGFTHRNLRDSRAQTSQVRSGC